MSLGIYQVWGKNCCSTYDFEAVSSLIVSDASEWCPTKFSHAGLLRREWTQATRVESTRLLLWDFRIAQVSMWLATWWRLGT